MVFVKKYSTDNLVVAEEQVSSLPSEIEAKSQLGLSEEMEYAEQVLASYDEIPEPIEHYISEYTSYIELGQERILMLEEKKKFLDPSLAKLAEEKIMRLKEAVNFLKSIVNDPSYIDKDTDGLVTFREQNQVSIRLSDAEYEISHQGYWDNDEYILEQKRQGKMLIPISLISFNQEEVGGNQVTGNAFKVISAHPKNNLHYNDEAYYKCVNKEEKELLLMYIEAGIYEDIEDTLREYAKTVQNEGEYCIGVILCDDNCWSSNIKEDLQETYNSNIFKSLAGAIFVGDIRKEYFQEYRYMEEYGVDDFVIDLYFMDLDGEWVEEAPKDMCKFWDECAEAHNDFDACYSRTHCHCKEDEIGDDIYCNERRGSIDSFGKCIIPRKYSNSDTCTCTPSLDCESIKSEDECDKIEEEFDMCWWKPAEDISFNEHNDNKKGDRLAEIFVSRINPPNENKESEMINKYLSKVISIKTGEIYLNWNAVWTDYFTGTFNANVARSLAELYPDSFSEEYYYSSSTEFPEFNPRKSVHHSFYQNNELAIIESHSNSNLLRLKPDGDIGINEISAINPKFMIMIFSACHINAMDYSTYLGRNFIFEEDSYVTSVLASSKFARTINMENIIRSLNEKQDIGHALLDWINTRIGKGASAGFDKTENYHWDYGISLQGDPTMKTNTYKSNKIAGCNIDDKLLESDCCSKYTDEDACVCAGCSRSFSSGYSYARREKVCKPKNYLEKHIALLSPKSENCPIKSLQPTISKQDLLDNCGICRFKGIYKIFEEGNTCDDVFVIKEDNPLLYTDSDGNYYRCIEDNWKKTGCWAIIVPETEFPGGFSSWYSYPQYRVAFDDGLPVIQITNDELCYPSHDLQTLYRCENQEWKECEGCYSYSSIFTEENEESTIGYEIKKTTFALVPKYTVFSESLMRVQAVDDDECYPVQGTSFEMQCTDTKSGIWKRCSELKKNDENGENQY
ncbi:MAG: hypothetical protein KKF44_03840 [Nanoarchaeota archaeon]|nr:hypothetical protein [Nanoarchaeota archaeon]